MFPSSSLCWASTIATVPPIGEPEGSQYIFSIVEVGRKTRKPKEKAELKQRTRKQNWNAELEPIHTDESLEFHFVLVLVEHGARPDR